MSDVKNNLIQLDGAVQKVNASLDENIKRIESLVVVYNKFGKEIATALPSTYVTNLNNIKTATESVEKAQAKLQITEKKLQQERLKELQLAKQREQAFDKYEKQLASENAKLQAASNTYNKLQVELNKLNNTYKDLATRKAQGATLTKTEIEQMTYLEKRIKQHDTTLKAVDASMGKYQRNVGNYAGAFNPLSNSINQLSREMPAFANSVQTGFMAISNNLPIFFDAMGGIIAQNKELQKQGQPTKSVLSQLAGAFFSWGTALSVGVTLLTVYGKEMVSFISTLWGASDAINELNKNQKDFNNSRIEGTKESIKDKTELEKYVKIMRNSNLTTEERAIALKKIRDQFPFYFKGLTDEVLLNGNITKNLQSLNLALERRGVLNKAQEANIKNKEKLIDLREELRLNEKSIVNAKKDLDNKNAIVQSQGVNRANRINQLKAEDYYNAVLEKQTKIKKDIIAYETAIATNKKIEINLAGKTIGLEAQAEEQGEKRVKRKEKEIKLDEELKFGTIAWLDAQISNLKTLKDTTSTTNEQSKEIENAIKYYEKWKDSIDGVNEKSKELNETQEEWTISIPELDVDIFDKIVKDKEALDAWLKNFKEGFKDDFVSNSGFSKLFDLIENFDKLKTDGVATALAISEAFQEAFNTIAKASQENFDAEYSRLEQQKSISLQFAGESTAAKENIEKQYEEKRKAIQKREAESQKRLAIFNIAVNTAQAIMAAVAKSPLTFGLPFSAIAAAIGAAQIAMVSSQQIPQFWKGTDNAPEGLAWTQEKGAEVITDRNGNVKTYGSNKGAQLTYLNKGDKVYKSHEDYINKELSKSGIQPMGQSFSSVNISNGLTKEDLSEQITRLSKTISQKENININIDKSGFKTAVNGKEYLNNRLTLKGRNV